MTYSTHSSLGIPDRNRHHEVCHRQAHAPLDQPRTAELLQSFGSVRMHSRAWNGQCQIC